MITSYRTNNAKSYFHVQHAGVSKADSGRLFDTRKLWSVRRLTFLE